MKKLFLIVFCAVICVADGGIIISPPGKSPGLISGQTISTTGDVTYTSGAFDGTAPVTGVSTVANVPTTATFPSDLTTIPKDTGGWKEYKVVTSDATTMGQTAVDIAGLVTDTLAINTVYEFECRLFAVTDSGTTGIQFATNCTVSPTNIYTHFYGPTTVSAGIQVLAISGTNANNTLTSSIATFLTTASEDGMVFIHGILTTAGTGSPVFSIRFAKHTSGLATVKIGSVMRIRKLQ